MKRVYLNTLEKVIKALKDGKEIFLEEGGAGKVKLIDGFCVKQWHDQFNINYTINLRDKPYILLEEEPFKIEVGNWYETRYHQKARCFIVEKERCHFTIDHYCHFFTNKDGVPLDNEMSGYNIIGPWKDDK